MSTYAVVNPATGQTIREYPTITADELNTAITAADATAHSWPTQTTIAERAEIVSHAGELFIERRQELAEILGREMGKPLTSALHELEFSATIYQYYAEHAEKLLADEHIDLLSGEGSALVRHVPLGAILGIMPWNYPYYQVARFAAPNLVLGNTVLLKGAHACPESSAAMADIFHQAGIPTDAYINLYATNEQVERIIADPRVHGVSLTGSERAGSAVAEIAGRHLKKVVLELGGSDPFIVLQTDDLDAVIDHAVHARLENAGQGCNAAKRFIIVDDLYEPFLAKLVDAFKKITPADPTLPDTVLGPVSSTAAADNLEDQLRRALDQGATLYLGGKREGNFFEPTVLTDINPNNTAAKEEFFGPIAQVYRAANEDDAIHLANNTTFGLGSYLITDDPDQAHRVANQLDTGMVYVNYVEAGGVELPFGGIKRSGFGRESGRYALEEFANKKLIRTTF
ncbi:NAD-dependent succinate-semialdehyde dehydrogenase [Mycolicibacterium sp. CBMA 335]|uniref:NAD-dependent succinate-semialdehyde dehydrogenase n=1 Tax=Mycolicibacterium sp. CBMA 335 TaxID=2606603 RepID=UPI0012DED267|nr:NAD-dependent succinate-semialdehyde dehydrogenase [Mycolicibacterium sp. CBMA 335]MUL62558.1 NAD-dependent succinate-semialdehyde dehydrogenase [Mycolicibacterium sp. CBMA 335]